MDLILVCFRWSWNGSLWWESMFLFLLPSLNSDAPTMEGFVLAYPAVSNLCLCYLCLLRSERLILSTYLQLQSDRCFQRSSWCTQSQRSRYFPLWFLRISTAQKDRWLTFDDTTVSQCHSWDGSDARGKVCGWREITDQPSLRAQEITNFLKSCFGRFAAHRGTCVCTAVSLFMYWHMRFQAFRHFRNNRDQRFNQAPVNQTTSSLGTNTHHSITF